MNKFSTAQKSLFLFFLVFSFLSGLFILIYLLSFSEIAAVNVFDTITALLNKPSSPFLFIAAMILLPPVGIPISLFLALAGIRFGVWGGMLLTFSVLPVHMTICYLVAHTFLRGPLNRLLARKGYRIPLLETHKPGLVMFGFLFLPGPPYALKTYLLAMTDMPYHRFLFVNWMTETIITLPIVAMTGAAAEKNWILFGLAIFVFGLSLGLRWYKKRDPLQRNAESRLKAEATKANALVCKYAEWIHLEITSETGPLAGFYRNPAIVTGTTL